MQDDMTLVQEFVCRHSEAAFSKLVERHIGLVHSAAMRMTNDTHLAEEVTQTVFIILARKAASFGQDTILSAWLYRATHYAASDALKLLRHRREREQEAYLQSLTPPEDKESIWQQLAPLLDNAMADLSEQDRTTLVLRYFENRPWHEVATTMLVTENAAQKRAIRAVKKLRVYFIRQGITLAEPNITDAVSTNAIRATPANLTLSTISAATGATTISTNVAILAKATTHVMTWGIMKLPFVTLFSAFLSPVLTIVISWLAIKATLRVCHSREEYRARLRFGWKIGIATVLLSIVTMTPLFIDVVKHPVWFGASILGIISITLLYVALTIHWNHQHQTELNQISTNQTGLRKSN